MTSSRPLHNVNINRLHHSSLLAVKYRTNASNRAGLVRPVGDFAFSKGILNFEAGTIVCLLG
jgi:hypothetical protein